MKVILTGATGMVGEGVLRECLLAPDVDAILSISRRPLDRKDPKLHELVLSDLTNFAPYEDRLAGYDACFFCLGVSSLGMTEEAYTRVTYDITLALASTLVKLNPAMTFVYVSGAGTATTGRQMWQRVKGRTEDAIFALGFTRAYAFRPGFIEPLHGVQVRVPLYRAIYALIRPFTPLLARLAPNSVTSTEAVGKAMLNAARKGAPKQILDPRDINALAV